MPSSPKIKKEDMLQAALELVSKNGYAALNIKAVAGELGCSTAPISWQFGGMDGLREELIPFAEQYVADKYYSRNENELATFEQRGKGTIDLALENPNLFRFLYTRAGRFKSEPPEEPGASSENGGSSVLSIISI